MNTDELVRRRAAQYDACAEAFDRLRRQHAALRVHAARLESDNMELRRKLRESSAEVRRLRKAHDNALLLLAYHAAGLHPSRRRMHEVMSLRAWDRARALLVVARVCDGRRIVCDEEVAVNRLAAAVERCAHDPELLRMRLPARG